MKKRKILNATELHGLWIAWEATGSVSRASGFIGVSDSCARRWITDIKRLLNRGRPTRIRGRKVLREVVSRIRMAPTSPADGPNKHNKIPGRDVLPDTLVFRASQEFNDVQPEGCIFHIRPGFRWEVVTVSGSVGSNTFTDMYAICNYCLLKKKI